MEANDTKLHELSQNTGINMLALKQKYQKEKKKSAMVDSEENNEKIELDEKQLAYNSLDKYTMCKKCNGQGYIKELYNHMWLDKTCDECDGECVHDKEILKKVQASLQESS